MTALTRLAARMTAVAAWSGLALQLVLLIDDLGAAPGTWRFLGFFTILANIGTALVATAIARGGGKGLGGPRARLVALTSIVTVGLVYSLLLRSTWNPQGWQKVADLLLHDASPLLFALLWALAPHGQLRWGDFKWAMLPPALYLAYALGRGAADGWYAYWFLNPVEQTAAELAASMAGVLAIFAVIAAAAIAIDRRLAPRLTVGRDDSDKVDEAGRESFPASDPPGWTLGPERE